jgi:Ras-related protein Rab-1A
MEPDYRYKAVIVGDGAVGKTTLIIRYTERRFRESYIPTIGVQFTVKEVSYQDCSAEFILWDIAGQEQFRFLRSGFYSGSDVGIIVFDVTDVVSFGNITNWFEELRRFRGNIPLVLLGNKIDLDTERIVSHRIAQELANNLGIPYYETSAKTGENVSTIFNNLVAKLIEGDFRAPRLVSAFQLLEDTDDLFSILTDLEEYIKENGRIPIIIDRVNDLSKKIFRENPYSPLLKDIAQVRWSYLDNYPSETITDQDRTHLLVKIREWQRYPIIQ